MRGSDEVGDEMVGGSEGRGEGGGLMLSFEWSKGRGEGATKIEKV